MPVLRSMINLLKCVLMLQVHGLVLHSVIGLCVFMVVLQ